MFIVSCLSLISASLAATCLRPFVPDGVQVQSQIDVELFQAGSQMTLWCQTSDLQSYFTATCEENGTWSGDSVSCESLLDEALPVKTSYGQCQTDCGKYGWCTDSCQNLTTEWTQGLLDSPDVLGVHISPSNEDGIPALSLDVSSPSESVECVAPAKAKYDKYVRYDNYVRCPLRGADRISIRFSESTAIDSVQVVAKPRVRAASYRDLPGYKFVDKYFFVERKMNYAEAKRSCEEGNGELLGKTTELEEELLKMRMDYYIKKLSDEQYISMKNLRTPCWIGASATNVENAMSGMNWARTYVNPEEEHYSICQFSKFNCTDFPGIPKAGRIIEHERGSKVTYECFDGYSMLGPSTRTCNPKKGEYEPEMPTCVKRFR